jgi:flagellar motor protein MotB
MPPDDDTPQSDEEPADSDQPAEQSDDQPTNDQPAEQTEEQPADDQPEQQSDEQQSDDQPAEQSEEQTTDSDQQTEQSVDSDQPAEQAEEQPADSDQPAEQSDSDQPASASADNTLAFAGGTASPGGGGGTGVQVRPGPQPKRSPVLLKRRFVFRFATEINSEPTALVGTINKALAGGLLAFRIEEVVSGKTVLVGRDGGATIPRPTLPPPSNVNTDDPGDLVYHFKSVGMDLSISLVVTLPILGADFSYQLEKVITRTDWHDSTKAGLPEPTFLVKVSVSSFYWIIPVSDGETLDGVLKAQNISRSQIFYLSSPRARKEAPHVVYDVMTWEFLSVWGDRLIPA